MVRLCCRPELNYEAWHSERDRELIHQFRTQLRSYLQLNPPIANLLAAQLFSQHPGGAAAAAAAAGAGAQEHDAHWLSPVIRMHSAQVTFSSLLLLVHCCHIFALVECHTSVILVRYNPCSLYSSCTLHCTRTVHSVQYTSALSSRGFADALPLILFPL